MQYPLSLVMAVFTFFGSAVITSLFFFFVSLVSRKKISPSKISIFLVSLSFLIVALAAFLFIVPLDQIKNIAVLFLSLELSEYVFFAVLFVLGIIFFFFTKIFLFAAVPAYIVFLFFSGVVLYSHFNRKEFFDLTVKAKNQKTATVVCYELNPMMLLPLQRIWYEEPVLDSVSEDYDIRNSDTNPIYKNMLNLLLKDKIIVQIDIPESDYYPAVYKLDVKNDFSNVLFKLEDLM